MLGKIILLWDDIFLLKMSKPKNWPVDGVVFISETEWKDRPIKYSQPEFKYKEIEKTDITPSAISKAVKIQKINDPNHPVYPYYGLEAAQSIPAKSYILDYRGIVKDRAKESKTSDYILHFDEEYSIDAEFRGNEGRFINDFRGVQDRPNVCFKLYRTKNNIVSMGVFSIGKIRKGQELVVTYGKYFWTERGIQLVTNKQLF